jgi:hypothetical protein
LAVTAGEQLQCRDFSMRVQFAENACTMRVHFCRKCGYYAGIMGPLCGYLRRSMPRALGQAQGRTSSPSSRDATAGKAPNGALYRWSALSLKVIQGVTNLIPPPHGCSAVQPRAGRPGWPSNPRVDQARLGSAF